MPYPVIISTNKLANHPAYSMIINQYNYQLRINGKVNAKDFFEQIIKPQLPEYKLHSWYKFLRKFKDGVIVVANQNKRKEEVIVQPSISREIDATGEAGRELALTMLSNNESLQQSIAYAMNISARALKDIMENPELVPAEKRAELFLKIMKAQDSRVKTVGAMRADNREQERFDRAMDSAAF